MKSIKLIIATTCFLGIVLGNFIDSAEARSRKRYSSRAIQSNFVILTFSLNDETADGKPIIDLEPNTNSGFFKGGVTDLQIYQNPIRNNDTGDFDFGLIDQNNIAKQLPFADLRVELIENADIADKLSRPNNPWTVDPSFKGNVITYKFLNPQSNEVLNTFYLVSDPSNGFPTNFNENQAVNSFQDIFTNNWLDLAGQEDQIRSYVELGDLSSPTSGPRLESNSVAVPEANSLNPLMLFGVLGMGFLLKRKSIK